MIYVYFLILNYLVTYKWYSKNEFFYKGENQNNDEVK